VETPGRIDVALAIPFRDRRFLVTRRQDGVHLAGYWEFPGGKIEAGEDPAEGSTRSESLTRALARLPRARRLLLDLHYVEGFGVAEMAEILGLPEGTVKSRLHTARQALRDWMERTER